MESEQQFEPIVSENIISQVWAKYFPYWPLFLFITGLAIGGTWLYLLYKIPVYESTATLLIKDEKKGTEDSKMMASLDMLTSKKIIENETEVIKSKTLMRQVVLQLQLYAPIFKKGRWRDFSAYAVSPIKIEVQNPESLVEVEKIDLSYDAAKQTVNLNAKEYSMGKWVPTSWGNLRFSAAGEANFLKGPFYFGLVNPKRVTQQLIKNLDVSVSNKLSSVINLKLNDEVAQRSDDILNALIIAYNKAAITDKNTLAENTLSFLDDRLKYVSNDLDSIEKQLQQYKARKGAIDISSQGKLFLENVSGNDQKLSDVNMRLAVLKQVEQYVLSNDSRGGLVPSTLGVDDPLLSNLLNKLYDAELEYEKIKRTTGENNPTLISLVDQIKKIKPGILENIHSQQSGLEANKRNLYSTNNSYSSLIQSLPQQERDLLEISREQNIKSSIYSFLLQKREETALSNSATVSDTRIVDKAESSLDPVGLSNKIIYVLAIAVALGIGMGIITLREFFNNTVLFRKEIEAITSVPIIGEISLEKSKSSLVIDDGITSLIAEQFRMLRTSLYYLGLGPVAKKLLITSTIPGEGKSFIAINLAMSLALSKRKVVLVEFDLNNPTLASKLGIDGARGVTDYLSGAAEADEVIRSIGDNDNFFIITAGNLPRNPSELILSERTKVLLEYLGNHYDYVIVDAAPVGVLSDAYILSRYCDATLYIIRHRHTPKKILERLEKNNKVNKLKNLAIVFNGVRFRGFGNYGNGYSYGYGYNYANQQKDNKAGNSKIKMG